ncbi:MAG: helix-turn-helix transcriptional regulator [Hyphomicrobiaceae bacterium]|nr:helix-turn-helix transcriptional regulator [Hyphomicrobiaceae bacterium]
MRDGPSISSVGALMGDPARANMLAALMGGEALTAGELALEAGVTPATASGHLARLLDGGLVCVEKQGRHRYFRLAGPEVGAAVEALMELAERGGRTRARPGPKDPEMRLARVCYDHLAGARGVELFQRLTRARLVALEDGAVSMTRLGEARIAEFGLDVDRLKAARRPVCRTCLDWSERRMHLAGGLGAGLLDRLFQLRWAYRVKGSRAVRFTPKGEAGFRGLFV